MTDLLILQACAPDYRKKFYAELSKRYPKTYQLYAGDSLSEPSVKTDYSIPEIHKISNHYFFSRRLLWQTGAFFKALKASYLVIELTPRNLSNWVLLAIRKLLGKKTALWGHAWPRAGKTAKTDRLRHIMRLLADSIILYTPSQATELKKIMPTKNITFAANALYTKNEMKPLDPNAPLGDNILYVGRLHADKKPLLALQAFAHIKDHLPKTSSLIYIGDGQTQGDILYKQAQSLGIMDRVIFTGHISTHKELQKYYHEAFVSLSPGYAGLSVTQSFGFGVPMVISRNDPHAPEIACAIEGQNCHFFETDNIENCAEKILNIHQAKNHWSQQKAALSTWTRERYSIEKMVEPFLEL